MFSIKTEKCHLCKKEICLENDIVNFVELKQEFIPIKYNEKGEQEKDNEITEIHLFLCYDCFIKFSKKIEEIQIKYGGKQFKDIGQPYVKTENSFTVNKLSKPLIARKNYKAREGTVYANKEKENPPLTFEEKPVEIKKIEVNKAGE